MLHLQLPELSERIFKAERRLCKGLWVKVLGMCREYCIDGIDSSFQPVTDLLSISNMNIC